MINKTFVLDTICRQRYDYKRILIEIPKDYLMDLLLRKTVYFYDEAGDEYFVLYFKNTDKFHVVDVEYEILEVYDFNKFLKSIKEKYNTDKFYVEV